MIFVIVHIYINTLYVYVPYSNFHRILDSGLYRIPKILLEFRISCCIPNLDVIIIRIIIIRQFPSGLIIDQSDPNFGYFQFLQYIYTVEGTLLFNNNKTLI